jgi:hypothetical protein
MEQANSHKNCTYALPNIHILFWCGSQNSLPAVHTVVVLSLLPTSECTCTNTTSLSQRLLPNSPYTIACMTHYALVEDI